MAQLEQSIPLIDDDEAQVITSQELSNSIQNIVIANMGAGIAAHSDSGDGPGLSCLKLPDTGDEDEPLEGVEGSDAGPTRRRNSRGAHVSLPPKTSKVDVKPATILREPSEDVYKMTAKDRGFCLIINNLDFKEILPYRHGSKEEGEMLEQLFTQLGFRVFQEYDVESHEMKRLFEEFSKKPENRDYDAFIGIILTHGGKNNLVHGSDNISVEVEEMISFFNNQTCPALVHKPKLFFIQACRGDKDDRGVAVELTLCSDAVGEGDLAARAATYKVPTWGDTVICYSTIDGFTSNRNEKFGSWFGDSLCKVITEHSRDFELHKLLMKVNNMLMAKEGSNNLKQSLEIVYRGWAKDFYFNPRLSDA